MRSNGNRGHFSANSTDCEFIVTVCGFGTDPEFITVFVFGTGIGFTTGIGFSERGAL